MVSQGISYITYEKTGVGGAIPKRVRKLLLILALSAVLFLISLWFRSANIQSKPSSPPIPIEKSVLYRGIPEGPGSDF